MRASAGLNPGSIVQKTERRKLRQNKSLKSRRRGRREENREPWN